MAPFAKIGDGDHCVEGILFPWAGVPDPPFGAMTCVIEPGRSSEVDRHNQDEIIFVYRGTGEFHLDAAVHIVGEATAVYIPRNVGHLIKNIGDGQLAFVSVWWPRIEPQGD